MLDEATSRSPCGIWASLDLVSNGRLAENVGHAHACAPGQPRRSRVANAKHSAANDSAALNSALQKDTQAQLRSIFTII